MLTLDIFTAELAKIAEGLLLFFSACSALSAVNLWFALIPKKEVIHEYFYNQAGDFQCSDLLFYLSVICGQTILRG